MPVSSKRIASLSLAFLLAFAVGCGGCRSKEEGKTTPGAFFPTGARGFVTVEDPSVLTSVASLLESQLAAFVATALAGGDEDPVAPLVGELGFDPRTPEGFASVGLDPSRSMAFGMDELGRRLVVVGVRDARAAERWMEEMARRQGGRTRTERSFSTEEGPEFSIPAFIDSKGTVRLAFATSGPWLVASDGPNAVNTVGKALAREEAKSLTATLAYTTTRSKLGKERAIWGWMPNPSKSRGRPGLLTKGYSFGLTVHEKDLDLRVRIPQGTLTLSVLQALSSVKPSESLLPFLSERDFLLTRVGGDPQGLEPLLRRFSAFRQLRRAGIDLSEDLLSQLRPGILVGISLEPEPNLSGGLPVQTSLSHTNPFHFLHTGILARVKDPEAARATLERLAGLGEKLSMEVSSREEEGLTIYSATYAAGDGLTWALVDDLLVAAGGEGAFEALLQRVKGEGRAYTPAHPEAFELFTSRPLSVYFDVPRLVSQLRAIPESAFGIGGFRLKALLDGWVAGIEEVRGVALTYHVDNEGIVLDARLGIE